MSGDITIKDVARKAGVSIATVSRVINKTGYVSESTRRRVEEAVALLGYSPNPSARILSGGTGRASSRKDILVFGSLNVDFVVRADRRPLPGETVPGRSFSLHPGGKGANQAVAASKAGGRVTIAGRIGDDIFSGVLTRSLLDAGVRGDLIHRVSGVSTGSAFITVDASGENSIIVVAGANGLVGREDVDRMLPVLDECGLILLQLEIPLDAVIYAARAARERGVTVMLDPAPPASLEPEVLSLVDYITPNRHEAEFLTGIQVVDVQSASQAAKTLVSKGVKCAVVKLGGEGVVYATRSSTDHIPGHKVDVVDTTAAGDAFSGALAAYLSEGRTLDEAVRFANAAGALAVTKEGAQPAIPWRGEIEKMLFGQ
ncbi:MAG: ribokinase [Bacillota bacterium]|jgi:ribokinase